MACIIGMIFILLHQTSAHFWHFLCTKAVNNLKTKSVCIIPTPSADRTCEVCANVGPAANKAVSQRCTNPQLFVPFSAFLLFLVSEVAHGEECGQ